MEADALAGARALQPPCPLAGTWTPIYFPTPQLEHGPLTTVLPPSAGPLELRSGCSGDGITLTPGLALGRGLGPTIQGRDMDPLHPAWDTGPPSSPGLASSLSCSLDFC
ncbi:T-cell receptor-associated transmembrane adapter 1 [Platysternon megacephalum]|nr:T-cell receptor-associated transmembrane adapter 1 [Platysternon megacephalum]